MACQGDKPEELPPFEHGDFYETLQGDAAEFTLVDGEWLDDYGDAAFYGPEFFCSGCNLQLLYVMAYRQRNITE